MMLSWFRRNREEVRFYVWSAVYADGRSYEHTLRGGWFTGQSAVDAAAERATPAGFKMTGRALVADVPPLGNHWRKKKENK